MSDVIYEDWEMVIGLETHVQLATKTKLFGSSPNRFGAEPNTLIDEVDTAQPGTLPVLNKKAVEFAVRLGLGLKSQIMPFSTFDRKSYFYPDAPRNFQITQFFNPILIGGTLTCDVEGETRHFKIHRAHLENDTGNLKHFGSFSGVDFNRAGVPLIEIVSEPIFHSPKEASSYASALRTLMQYLEIAHCNMDQGGMRMDVNVSVRPKNSKELRPKVEIKNMNSFRNMELAIESEFRRQVAAYAMGGNKPFEELVFPGTYRFDLASGKTVLMRSKEDALDYRYFHEPDLVPIILSNEKIQQVKKTLPELPHDRFLRYCSSLNLSNDRSALLTGNKYTSDFFEKALAISKDPNATANWILVEFGGRLKEKGQSLAQSSLKPEDVGSLVAMVITKKITGKMAKDLADQMLASNQSPLDLIKKDPAKYQTLQDEGLIGSIVDEVLKQNPSSITDYKAGRTKALAYLVGQVMKQTKGQADPALVNKLLLEKMG